MASRCVSKKARGVPLARLHGSIISAAIFLSTGHDQSVVLQPGEDRPNAPMIDGHCVSKCDSI
jgi:hypothetical protein